MDKLETLLEGNVPSFGDITSIDVSKLMKHVDVRIGLNEETFDSYMYVDVDELLKSEIDESVLEVLSSWYLTEDKKKVLKYKKSV